MNSHKLHIIYEDDVLLVCNKPAGLMVEPDRNNHPNLLQYVKDYLKQTSDNKHLYVQHLHRLDRVTSGLILFTKQKEYLRNLSEQFAKRQVQKQYIALTKNAPIQLIGTLNHWHRKEKKKAVLVSANTPFAENVRLDYKVIGYHNNFLWNIDLHTGKYHQIRVQLASLNCAIIGDELYGSDIKFKPNAIALHAFKLLINHTIKQETIEFTCPPDFIL